MQHNQWLLSLVWVPMLLHLPKGIKRETRALTSLPVVGDKQQIGSWDDHLHPTPVANEVGQQREDEDANAEEHLEQDSHCPPVLHPNYLSHWWAGVKELKTWIASNNNLQSHPHAARMRSSSRLWRRSPGWTSSQARSCSSVPRPSRCQRCRWECWTAGSWASDRTCRYKTGSTLHPRRVKSWTVQGLTDRQSSQRRSCLRGSQGWGWIGTCRPTRRQRTPG